MLDSLLRRARVIVRPIQPLIDAFQLWLGADGLRMSAAMSFYGILSLAPLLLLLVGLLGWWVDRAYVETNLLSQVQAVIGERGAQVVQAALASAQKPSEGTLASLAGFVLLLSGATGVFVELQSALEKLWQMGMKELPAPKAAWWRMATLRLRGLAYVLALGFLLMVSMVLSTAVHMLTTWAGSRLPIVPLAPLIGVINEGVAFAVAVALFVGLMRIGTGPKPPLRFLLFGAVVGATLFTLGKQGLAWYLSTAAVVSAYGAAGSIVVLLMWIYFSSAILLFAAATAKAVCDARTKEAGRLGRVAQQPGSQLPGHAGENI
ncbi:YihY/virulence factor BrkB family protein [Pantoea sp. 18069]|uniref:YihY/virulence factor BrkB family protein n=1 Tax=Pantoea sp. 18069 TaxID=2681415 RepID=UPI00190FAFD3|nr:YihY/virulence factor BrkB family protein [Pantoea sp. 18069]